MHVSFCSSSGGEAGTMHVSSDLSTHFSPPISDIPFKYPLTDREQGVQESGGGWGVLRLGATA